MDVAEFCRKIRLGVQEQRIVAENKLPEKVWRGYWGLYSQDHDKFFEEIRNKEEPEKWFLILYCHFACEMFSVYRERGIKEEIFWDTFRDIAYWCENGVAEYGKRGIYEYRWFQGHFDLRIFRLGRLEFELGVSQWEVPPCPELKNGVSVGQPVICIHIPQGSPLDEKACNASLIRARQWFGNEKPYLCYSWLLHPAMGDILPEDSRIRQFARRFSIIWVNDKERDGERRIFGRCLDDPADYPAVTSLQKSARAYLMGGGRIGEALGVLKESFFKSLYA